MLDLRITSVSSRVARQAKACVSCMFVGCSGWRLLAVDGGPGTSRGHVIRASSPAWKFGRRAVSLRAGTADARLASKWQEPENGVA
jgi:hypothetical protein